MHNGQRNDDRARPRRHLVDEVAEQHHLGRDDRRLIARKQIEQAQIDLDVAVGRLDAAQRKDDFSRPRQPQIVIVQTSQLQGKIRFHRRAEIRGPLWINVEAAIRQLPLEDRSHGFIDKRAGGWIPNAILGRMQPELQKDVVGFERGIGGEQRRPVTSLICVSAKCSVVLRAARAAPSTSVPATCSFGVIRKRW